MKNNLMHIYQSVSVERVGKMLDKHIPNILKYGTAAWCIDRSFKFLGTQCDKARDAGSEFQADADLKNMKISVQVK